jgi:hypothetical protein
MSNARYYARRAAGRCGDCGIPTDGAYCPEHREARRVRVVADRQTDRAGWNLYMRIYRQHRRRGL